MLFYSIFKKNSCKSFWYCTGMLIKLSWNPKGITIRVLNFLHILLSGYGSQTFPKERHIHFCHLRTVFSLNKAVLRGSFLHIFFPTLQVIPILLQQEKVSKLSLRFSSCGSSLDTIQLEKEYFRT